VFRVPGDLGFTGNIVPSFISPDGPIREARFQYNSDGSRDGGVHALFVITGHPEAAGCNIRQEDFERQIRNRNIIFRIPTPTFGTGLIEQLRDSAILANLAANPAIKASLGISGRPNRNGNDGTISRFGWKAQNQSLLLFSGEAYNVEMGITNELFQNERDETPSCQFATVPNDVTPSVHQIGAIRLANPALPGPRAVAGYPGGASSISRGRRVRERGLRALHADARTGNTTVLALASKDVNLFSDIALPHGARARRRHPQGGSGDEFRTSPLWGSASGSSSSDRTATSGGDQGPSQRRQLKFGPSEANAVIDRFNHLDERDKQDLLSFLRSL
jgi:CxxC motif-containing protein (DUF1111 family)